MEPSLGAGLESNGVTLAEDYVRFSYLADQSPFHLIEVRLRVRHRLNLAPDCRCSMESISSEKAYGLSPRWVSSEGWVCGPR